MDVKNKFNIYHIFYPRLKKVLFKANCYVIAIGISKAHPPVESFDCLPPVESVPLGTRKRQKK